MKLTAEERKNLPKEIVEGLDNGTMIAVPIERAGFSGTWFSALSGVFLVLGVLPMWFGFTWFTWIVLTSLAWCWMFFARLESKTIAMLQTTLHASNMVISTIEGVLTEAIDSKEDKDDGTKSS